jgi:hypothetical protein
LISNVIYYYGPPDRGTRLQLTCDYEGWTPTGTPECEGLACDNDFAKNFENGEITFTDTNKVNSVATITCSSGYVIEGKVSGARKVVILK